MAKKKESKQKKINVRVDFTPMVDMLMLLITFFMLCTTLSKPSTMELTMPSNDENVQEDQKNEAKATQSVVLYLAANDKIYYQTYKEDGDPNPLKETNWGEDLRNVLRYHETGGITPVNRIILETENLRMDREQNPTKYNDSTYQKALSNIKRGEMPDGEKIGTVTVIIKPTENSTFDNMMDILDEMQILSIGTYVIDKLNPDDHETLKKENVEE